MSSVSGNILWSAPRSMSTAFFRAIESHPDTMEAYFEPFCKAYHLSEDRLSARYSKSQLIPGCGYMDAKQMLENALVAAKAAAAAAAAAATPNSGGRHRQVFVKDIAYAAYDVGQDLQELLPRGYRHAFLVRNPRETLRSLYRVSNAEKLTDWRHFDEKEAGFRQLWKLYEFVRDRANEEGAPPPMVIESSDLLQSPEKYLRAYCDYIGLKFDEALLKWKPGAESVVAKEDCWDISVWFGRAVSSSGFWEPKAAPTEATDPLPECLERCVQENLGYYENFVQVKTRLA